jgi:thymidine phosphorylase
MTAALGAPADFVEHSEKYLPQAAHVKPVYTDNSGYITAMDARAVGLSIVELGGGRSVPTQKLDLATGYSDFAQIGDYVDAHTPLAMVHYQTEEQYERAAKALQNAISIGDNKPELSDPIMLKL